jgi:hypothetical protein
MSSISMAVRVRVREGVGVGRRGIVGFVRWVFGLLVLVYVCLITRSFAGVVFACVRASIVEAR